MKIGFLIIYLMLLVSNASESIITPALPSIAEHFAVSKNQVQFSISLFMIAFALSQLFYGYYSDKYGRKKLFILGSVIFIIGNLLCMFANNFTIFLLGRVVQGIGASAGSVLARAIVRDALPPLEQRKIFAKVLSIITFTPIIAPIIGGFLLHLDWRVNFFSLASLTIAVLVIAALQLKESNLTPNKNSHFISALKYIFPQKQFLFCSIIGGCLLSLPMVYITQAPFVFIKQFHLSPFIYSLSFIIVAGCGCLGSQVTAKLVHKFSNKQFIQSGIMAAFVLAVILLIFNLFEFNSIGLCLSFIGLIMFASLIAKSTVSTQAMLSIKKHFGVASAILGSTQMLVASAITLLLQIINHHIHNSLLVLSLTYTITLCAGLICTTAIKQYE